MSTPVGDAAASEHRSAEPSRKARARAFWRRSQQSPSVATIMFIAFAAGVIQITLTGAEQMGYNWQWYNIPQYFLVEEDGEWFSGVLIDGLLITLEIAAWCVVLTLLVGLITALLRTSNSLTGSALATGYLELVRNTPLLVQLYLFYFVLAPILDIDRFATGIVCLTFYEGAFVAEIIRAGIQSVARGQWEASDSVGLTRADVYRFVILPQAVPLMLPPLTGQIINLIKHSAIVSVIAVADLTTAGRNVIADTFMSFEVWLTVAAVYLVITISLSVLVSYMEHRVRMRS
jgi:polar amino acid transport system permease protein